MYLLFEKEKKAGKCVSIHLFLCAFSIFAEIKKKKSFQSKTTKCNERGRKKKQRNLYFFRMSYNKQHVKDILCI